MPKRPISVQEAAEIRGVREVSILMAIQRGTLFAVKLSGKGWLLSEDQVRRKKFSESAFKNECEKWICVPEACEIMHKTDVMVIRDVKSGVVDGFRLNRKAWAIRRESAEREFAEYLETMHERKGRPRDLGRAAFSPRVVRKKTKKVAPRKRA
jgi:excisionase family DNA binding protein